MFHLVSRRLSLVELVEVFSQIRFKSGKLRHCIATPLYTEVRATVSLTSSPMQFLKLLIEF